MKRPRLRMSALEWGILVSVIAVVTIAAVYVLGLVVRGS